MTSLAALDRPPLDLTSLPDPFSLPWYCLSHWAEATPDREALIIARDPDRPETAERWTYRTLTTSVLKAATVLADMAVSVGAERGARVLIRLPNNSAYAFAFFGAIAAGLIPIPASDQLTDAEADYLVEDSAAAMTLVPGALGWRPQAGRAVLAEDFIRAIDEAGPLLAFAGVPPETPAFIIYTSGTKGRPKGVLHAHRVVWGRRPMFAGWHAIGPGDRILHAGAFNWTYTIGIGLMDAWTGGGTAILYVGERTPAVWPTLAKAYRATVFCAVPSLYRQILKYGADLAGGFATIRHGMSAGEALSPSLYERFIEVTGKPIYEGFGMSEMSTYISSAASFPVRPGSLGKPQPGRRVEILPREAGTTPLPDGEVGLIAVHESERALFLGYWNKPDETAAVRRGEWFLSGDLARRDADGYVWFEGRADDVMNAMGYRVAPEEVERVLRQHPDVHEVAVAEVRVAADLSVIMAFVVPEGHGHRPLPDPQAILDFAAKSLARYKLPREIVFMESLPRTRTGKALRRTLAAAHEESLAKRP